MAPLDERTIKELARVADLPLTAERLHLIAPQLDALVEAANELNRKMAEPRMSGIAPNVRFAHVPADGEARS